MSIHKAKTAETDHPEAVQTAEGAGIGAGAEAVQMGKAAAAAGVRTEEEAAGTSRAIHVIVLNLKSPRASLQL